jgi:predicted nucleotidyltransferase
MVRINASIDDLIRQFISRLNEQGIRIKSAYLYGSYARGTETKWSDIDVAIVSPDISDDRFEERLRLVKTSAVIDSRIEPVPFNPKAFVDEDPLVWEIKKEGVLIVPLGSGLEI